MNDDWEMTGFSDTNIGRIDHVEEMYGFANIPTFRMDEEHGGTSGTIDIAKMNGFRWDIRIEAQYDPTATDWLWLHLKDQWSPHFFVWSANPYEDDTAVPIGLRVRTEGGKIPDTMIPVVPIPDGAHVFDGTP